LNSKYAKKYRIQIVNDRIFSIKDRHVRRFADIRRGQLGSIGGLRANPHAQEHVSHI